MSEEEAKVAEIKETVAERQRRCDEDLAKAEPAVRQAEAALDTLNKVRHIFEHIFDICLKDRFNFGTYISIHI